MHDVENTSKNTLGKYFENTRGMIGTIFMGEEKMYLA